MCIAGAGFGLSLSRWIGLDDSIFGIWLAGALGASALWLDSFLVKRNIGSRIPFRQQIIYLTTVGGSLWSFYRFNIVNIHAGQIAGLDKLTFGMLLGGVGFYATDALHLQLKKKYGKVFFPFQRIVLSLGSLLVLSIFIYILINYYI
ncbi:MAG: hypothetical protein HY377_02360 [Candidatus Blackburnbacteria bacterium]|nr:hypothetical protein [Candidatus Blackburnbacteria bacterium]